VGSIFSTVVLTALSAGILDNVTRERDSIFEQQKVHDNVKAVVSALLAEMNHGEKVNGTKEDQKD